MKPSRNNAFTPNLCAITGNVRTSSFVMDALSPQNYGRAGRNGTAAERTEKTISFVSPSAQIVIGSKADSDKRASFSKARI